MNYYGSCEKITWKNEKKCQHSFLIHSLYVEQSRRIQYNMNWFKSGEKTSNEKVDLVLILDPQISDGSSTQAETGREVKAGDRNFLKSCIYFMIKSQPPIMSKYTRIVTIFLPSGF